METIIKLYLFVFRVGLTCGETDMMVSNNGAKWEKYIGVCERILNFLIERPIGSTLGPETSLYDFVNK